MIRVLEDRTSLAVLAVTREWSQSRDRSAQAISMSSTQRKSLRDIVARLNDGQKSKLASLVLDGTPCLPQLRAPSHPNRDSLATPPASFSRPLSFPLSPFCVPDLIHSATVGLAMAAHREARTSAWLVPRPGNDVFGFKVNKIPEPSEFRSTLVCFYV